MLDKKTSSSSVTSSMRAGDRGALLRFGMLPRSTRSEFDNTVKSTRSVSEIWDNVSSMAFLCLLEKGDDFEQVEF